MAFVSGLADQARMLFNPLFNARGSDVVTRDGTLVRQTASAREARAAVAQLNGHVVCQQMAAVEGDEDPKALAGALDAALDAAADLLSANDATSLPPWAQQVMALVTAAETVADELLEVMGVPDPDDTDTDD